MFVKGTQTQWRVRSKTITEKARLGYLARSEDSNVDSHLLYSTKVQSSRTTPMGDHAIARKGDNENDGHTQPPCLATAGEPHCKCLSFTVDRQSVCDQISLGCPLKNLLSLHATRNSAPASMPSRCTSDNAHNYDFSWIGFKLDTNHFCSSSLPLWSFPIHISHLSKISCFQMLLLGSMRAC